MLGMARYCAKKEEDGKNNENICLITGIGCLILFNALTGYSLYTDFTKIENLSLAAVDINQITFAKRALKFYLRSTIYLEYEN